MWLKLIKLAKFAWKHKKEIYMIYSTVKPIYKNYIEPKAIKAYNNIFKKKKPEIPESTNK